MEIITIGDELLIGQVVDTNSAWMSKELSNNGFEVSRITTIRDKELEIVNALDESLKRTDVLLLTGGLGPTKDDITKLTLTKYFNTELVFNSEIYENVKRILKNRVKSINKLNRSQALVPKDCVVINNEVGTAPIMIFEKENKIVVSMPGVPFEMELAMTKYIIPFLKNKYPSDFVNRKVLVINNIPESSLALMLEDLENHLPENINLSYLPAPGIIRLRITIRSKDKDKSHLQMTELVNKIHYILGDAIVAYDDINLAQIVFNHMVENNYTLGLAESCTGGNIAKEITSLAGSSKFFKGGIVTYSNQVKESVLGVNANDINNCGAVSKVVVEQMAKGAQKVLDVDYAIATSGIAGPEGGTKEKPVGTVWIAVADKKNVVAQKYTFSNAREYNIKKTTNMAFSNLLELIGEVE